MDLQAKLDEIVSLVEGARAMPMSASCVLNRGELLAHLDELRELIPDELHQAQGLLRERADVIDEGRREADRIIADAEVERGRLVSVSEVAAEAAREADRIVAAAHAETARMRAEIDDYVDTKLATFEIALQKTLRAVERGRAKLRSRTERSDELPELPDLDVSEPG